MTNNDKYLNKEKLILFSITFAFLFVILLLFFTPKLIAESKDQVLNEKMYILQETLRFIQKNYVDIDKVKTEKLLEGAMKGMFEALEDPHSAYLTIEDMKKMQETTTGKFGGVGLYILYKEDGTEVSRPISGTPAYKAGVQGGDLIIAVDGEDVVGMPIDEVVSRLKGIPGTDVIMTIRRGKKRVFDVKVTRDYIELPTVLRDMLLDNIGYMHILQFTPLTDERVKEAISYFEENQYKSLIIDLRSNPGGLLSSVVDVADNFFPPGQLIVGTESRIIHEKQKFLSKKKQIIPSNIPIVVLIDKYSASASEILTGALKDTKRAHIIGQKTYGKGSVQQIKVIGESGFRLTISKYYTPNKVFIDGEGIAPDKIIEDEKLSAKEESSLEKFLEKEKISEFVGIKPEPSENDIKIFIDQVKKEGYTIKDRYIRRLIRNEVNRTKIDPPIYDLDFDLDLQEAVYFLRQKKGVAK